MKTNHIFVSLFFLNLSSPSVSGILSPRKNKRHRFLKPVTFKDGYIVCLLNKKIRPNQLKRITLQLYVFSGFSF